MKKFLVLLKKEIRELLTLQMILPLIITIILFMFVGKVIGSEQEKIQNKKQEIILIDQDQTQTSQLIEKTIGQNLNVEKKALENMDQLLEEARKENKSLVVVVPEGFEKDILAENPKKVEVYSVMRNFSFTGSKSYEAVSLSLSAVNEALSNQLIGQNTTSDPTKLKHPLAINDHLVIGKKKADVSPLQAMGFIANQTTFIPIILFMVIILASQMIATAIASEKENKTLETLLTAPVSRNYIVVAKMAGAGIVALLSSFVYMLGFRSYMNGLIGDQSGGGEAVSKLLDGLGLTFSTLDYTVLGVSLFFGILAALAISLILGAFAEDIKSVAGLTSPLMILVAIPYFLTMFLDINSLPAILKYVVYAIPFSHSFLAAPNILLDNYWPIIGGIIYQFIFFVIFTLVAARIFSTDRIVTMKLNFSKKR